MNDSFDAQTIRIKPYYVFSTISLALVILLLAILFPRDANHIAEVSVHIRAPADGQSIPASELQAKVRGLLADPAQVQRAVANLLPELNAGMGERRKRFPFAAEGTDEAPDMLGALITRQLDIQFLPSEATAPQQVMIRFGSPARTTAINVVAAVAHHLATSLHEWTKSDDVATAGRVAELKRQIAEIRQRRAQLVEQQVAMKQDADRQNRLAADKLTAEKQVRSDRKPRSPRRVSGLQTDAAPTLSQNTDGLSLRDDLVDLGGRTPGSSSVALQSTRAPASPLNGERAAPQTAVDSNPQLAGPKRKATSEVNKPTSPPDPAAETQSGFPLAAHQPAATTQESSAAESGKPAERSSAPPGWGDRFPSADISANPGLGRNPVPEGAVLSAPQRSIEPSNQHRRPQVVEPNPKWTEVSEEIARMRMDLREMLKVYTPRHPLADDLVTRIEDLEEQLKGIPQFVEIESNSGPGAESSQDFEPVPSLSPIPAQDRSLNEPAGEVDSPADPEQRAVWVAEAVDSAEYKVLTNEINALQADLAKAINEQQQHLTAWRQVEVDVDEPKTTAVHARSISILDILTYLLPACIVGLAAAAIRSPDQPPAELYSTTDVEDAMGLSVVGAVSTTDGPKILAPSRGCPPSTVLRLVFASEVLLVATAVLLVMSCIQIEDFTAELVRNPIYALVMSIDTLLNFIRSFF